MDHDLNFQQEIYQLKLVLNIPNNDHNGKIAIIPIRSEIINQRNEIMELHAIGNLQLKSPSMLRILFDKFRTTIGLAPSSRDIEITLSEKFSNKAFDISVINIEILEAKLLLNYATLETKALLWGIRRILFEWFWIASFTIIFWSSLVAYAILVYRFKIIDVVESKVMPAEAPRNNTIPTSNTSMLNSDKKTTRLSDIQFNYRKEKYN